jgi:PPM family protein phosphatase
MRFAVYQLSRKGGREKNEDRMGYCYTREAGLFILADGMGGHPEGEVAAQISLQTLAAQFQSTAKPKLDDPLRFLNDAIMAAHHEMVRYATEQALLDTPRTTIVACLVQGDQAWWAHCGDSRLYLVRGGKLAARTRDHSYSELQQALPASAGLPERVNRNVLFTCLGSPGRPVVDAAGPLKLQAGDRVMLCSDGLWGNLGDPEITQALAQTDIAKAVPGLVEAALRQGGARCDNVTVLAVDFEGAETVDKVVSTEELGNDGFASTIQASLVGGDTGYDDLDEEEIERSIREINDAIARSSAKRG